MAFVWQLPGQFEELEENSIYYIICHNYCQYKDTEANGVDVDQTSQNAAPGQDLHLSATQLMGTANVADSTYITRQCKRNCMEIYRKMPQSRCLYVVFCREPFDIQCSKRNCMEIYRKMPQSRCLYVVFCREPFDIQCSYCIYFHNYLIPKLLWPQSS